MKIAIYILFGWMIVGSLYLTYAQYVDGHLINNPITFNTDIQNLQTDKSIYHRGDTVYVMFSVCKNRNYTVKTTWRLINETVVTYPDQGSRIAALGCVVNKWFSVGIVPPDAIAGEHHLEGVSAIQLNPLNTVYVDYRSKDFQVE